MRCGGQQRRYWSRSRLRPERRRQFGMYDQLLEKCVRKYIFLILHAPVDIRSVFGLSVMHPVCVLIVRYMFVCCPSLIQRHLFCWTEALRNIFVTDTFQPFLVRCTYFHSFWFSIWLTFLPPDNKNSYPFHVRRFNPVKCDRGFSMPQLLWHETSPRTHDCMTLAYTCWVFSSRDGTTCYKLLWFKSS